MQENLDVNAPYKEVNEKMTFYEDLVEDVAESCNIDPNRLGVIRKYGSWYQLIVDGDPVDENVKYNRLAFKNYLRGISDGCKLI